MTQGRQPVAYRFESREHACVFDEGNLGFAMRRDVRQLFWRQRVVETDRDSTRMQQSEVSYEVFGPVASEDDAKAAAAEAKRLQTVGKPGNLVAVRAP